MPSTKSSRKRQARLAFTPLPSSSPAAKGYNQQIQDRAAAVTLDSSPAKRRKTRQSTNGNEVHNFTESDQSAILTPEPSIERQRTTGPEIDNDHPSPRSTRRSAAKYARRSRPRQQQLDFSNARDVDSFDSPIKLPSSSAQARASTQANMFNAHIQIDSSSSGEDSEQSDEIVVKNSKQEKVQNETSDDNEDELPVGTQRRRQRQMTKSSPHKAADSEDDDEMPTTVGTQRRGRRKRRTSHSSFIADSPPQAIDSDSDDLIILPGSNRKRLKRLQRSTSVEGTEEESASESPNDRGSKKHRQLSERERRELADDLDDLASSSTGEELPSTHRVPQSGQKSARQQALDKLKRLRSSQLGQVEDEDDAGGPQAQNEDQEDESSQSDGPDGDRHTSSHHMFSEDADDKFFIEEDDEDDGAILGVPADLPLEFTRYASMKPKELFKHAVEWMVCKFINPAFASNDPLYRLAFRKLDDEVRGLAGSKFTSSAWTQDFTVALQARPDYGEMELDRRSAEGFFRDKCDACNRSNHPPAFELQFHLKPYHRETLEEVSHEGEDGYDEDSQSNSADETGAKNPDLADWDEQGREVPPESTVFYVGRFCMENARTAHKLQHWRYHLYQYVDIYLQKSGYRETKEVVKRDSWKTKKRQKYAEKIVDRMEQVGEIRKLYQRYREAASDARSSKQGRYAIDSP